MTDQDGLRDKLQSIAEDEAGFAPELADLAIRRWRSFGRRHKTRHPSHELRVRDLAKGLKQGYPGELIFLPPGVLERVAEQFAEVLRSSAFLSAGGGSLDGNGPAGRGLGQAAVEEP
ncbi:hypothetical protein [Paractinoplanes atraurantiacus]|uniref:Uncharacterized protein n=1 Tax=Paractinoplanes atraurantiacus TaxID=1036182 RepID=A0A285IQ19_9ACTN|nr:hypothetical protein [Actinoplanes atraurantiacus]SNY49186.1 hypothetical protein SAMN05421748_109244 [Actinoplanes atraurantiacus]